jgi:hypothetical protein
VANPCSPNSSVPVPGLGSTLTYSAAMLANWLLGQGMGWLAPFVPRIGGRSYDLPSFCSADPPPAPTTDPTTIANFFSPLNPTGAADLNAWLIQVVDYNLWFHLCECSAAPQPTPPAPVAQPPTLNTQPPNTTPPADTSCLHGSIFSTYSNPGAGAGIDAYPNGTGAPLLGINPSTLKIVEQWGVNTAPFSFQVDYIADTPSAPGVTLGTKVVSNTALNNQTLVFAWPVGQTRIRQHISNWTGAGVVGENNTFDTYCNGGSPNASQNCCPPDPTLISMLAEIEYDLTQLLSLSALQGAYQDTTRHAGLSGSGTIAINPASSAIRVEVRTDLTNWPQNVQTPPYFYSLGFVTPFAVGTPLKGQRLVYDRQIFTWPSYTDTIGYTVPTGIVIDLVELTRGA